MRQPLFDFWYDLVQRSNAEADMLSMDMGDGELVLLDDIEDIPTIPLGTTRLKTIALRALALRNRK